ncbi:glycerate kinase [Propionivibrio dicarboxylicus]|uniref:Glycerate kinase n=1 Tax=Propionivibrio dicarboxylicus TaxID=83767 RepID=A0A1G7V3C8_9RHOO|nr:glycerate kinase [Propionivibrio dicarboxylicus]SDG54011.1 glycerate kinase [Propionivibrio dicarboxylicus]
MRIIVAPDSYKGSVSALGVAQAMERGILKIHPDADVLKMPIADGGEGTVEALVAATGGELRHQDVADPLGRRIRAHWGILGDGRTAVIEMASASGLPLLASAERDPLRATTYGTGELLRAALDAGLRKIIIGIGGSATNDGGAGMARALGVRFIDAAGKELPDGGSALARLAAVDLSGIDPRLGESDILVACDVDNPLCGPRGASAVFGPQKGATPALVAELDAALWHFATIAQAATGRTVAETAGAGAAGGMGAGLLLFTPAKLRPGVEIVLDAVRFGETVKGADFVITGEGRTDFQTAFGKAPVGVAKAAKLHRVPVFCLSGSLGEGADETLAQGIDAVMSICDRPMALDECMARGEELIEAATTRLCRILRAARR